jgi:ribosomal protein L34
MRKHGLEKRLSQPSQREILFRRILKGRKNMTTFDRFMNDLPDHFLKPKGKRVELTDPKRGYKSIIKKKDKFIFKEI